MLIDLPARWCCISRDRILPLIAPNAFVPYCVQNRICLKEEGNNETGDVLLSTTEPHRSKCVKSWQVVNRDFRVFYHYSGLPAMLQNGVFGAYEPTTTQHWTLKGSARVSSACNRRPEWATKNFFCCVPASVVSGSVTDRRDVERAAVVEATAILALRSGIT